MPGELTVEQILALPIFTGLDYIEQVQSDGSVMRLPTMAPGRCQEITPDTIAFCQDREGRVWSPYLHTDDKWYKKERHAG